MTNALSATPIRRSRVWATLQALLRARITAGLVVVLPIWITYLLVKFLFEVMRDTSLWVVEKYLSTGWGRSFVAQWGVSPEAIGTRGLDAFSTTGRWIIGILCVFLTIFFLYVVGVLTANFLGKRFMAGVEGLLDRVPLVKTVYRATKQILATLAGEQAKNFQRVALIPFPSRDMRSVGFITSIMKDTRTGEELCSAFIASTPNPTTGFLFIVRRADIIELDWSVEDAISAIMSGGVIIPAQVPFGAISASNLASASGGGGHDRPPAVSPADAGQVSA